MQHSAGRRYYVRENLEGKNGGSVKTEKMGYERLAQGIGAESVVAGGADVYGYDAVGSGKPSEYL